MKECSKVWYKCKHPGDTISSKYTFYCGWKTALEWALTQDTDLNATELADAIGKELNATSKKRC